MMLKFTRIAFASLALVAVTVVPAAAAPAAPVPTMTAPSAPNGLCQRWPRLCGMVAGAQETPQSPR